MARVNKPFNGQLIANEIYSSLFNMIISQEVFSNNIGGLYDALTSMFMVDGSEYGDTKLYAAVQLGKVEPWGNDSEAVNLLALNRPANPYVQAITLGVFKKIWLTYDNFLSKRAWGSEGMFAQFNSVILSTISDTKRVYFTKLVNVMLGTTYAGATLGTSQRQTVTMATHDVSETPPEAESVNRLRGQQIAKQLADVLVELQDASKDYNDLGYERAYDPSEFIVLWNAAYRNEITYLDLPTIFQQVGIADKLQQYTLPAKYFGTISSATTSVANARAVYEMDAAVGAGAAVHYRPGDTVATGATVVANSTYSNVAKRICLLIHKDAFKMMAGFQTESEFFNPRSQTSNHYSIFGHTDPAEAHLLNFPVIAFTEA